ncbi:MAG: glycosyltransferase family 2 protein [Bacteroides sp.]|nr:glycosyltransferase family 2 protein [Bacteroides sp.]
MKKVSILIPVYNEEKSLPLLHSELNKVMTANDQYEWEVLFVNDGSSDCTLQLIKEWRVTDKRICYVDLTRNFGKEIAMLAGFDYVTGDCVVVMDADLQHPPHLIPQMLQHWEEGYEDVYAKRTTQGKENWFRKHISLSYYKLLQKLIHGNIQQNVGDFRLLDRKCIQSLQKLRECEQYSKGLFCWIGYKKKEICYHSNDRITGHSKWNFWNLLNLGINGLTSFTIAPLRLSSIIGFIISLVAFTYMCIVLVKALIWGDPVQGFPSLMIVILFLGGVQLISLGVIGEYLGRIFNETKNRPTYIAREYNDRSCVDCK